KATSFQARARMSCSFPASLPAGPFVVVTNGCTRARKEQLMRARAWKLVALPAALAAIAASGTSHAGDGIREVVVYGINNFGYAPLCGNDPSMTHTNHTETAAAFRAEFEDLQSSH